MCRLIQDVQAYPSKFTHGIKASSDVVTEDDTHNDNNSMIKAFITHLLMDLIVQ